MELCIPQVLHSEVHHHIYRIKLNMNWIHGDNTACCGHEMERIFAENHTGQTDINNISRGPPGWSWIHNFVSLQKPIMILILPHCSTIGHAVEDLKFVRSDVNLL
jgi:hypothetical protein